MRIVTLAMALGLSAVGPARAFLPSPVQYLGAKQVQQQEAEGYWNPKVLEQRFRTLVGGLALSADYRYGTQDFCNPVCTKSLTSEAELNSYLLRPELVISNWLSVYGIAALHEGTNRAPGVRVDMDGWGAGVGATSVFGLPEYPASKVPGLDAPVWKQVTLDPLFIAPDFNWTYNDFEDIENSVKTSNLTIRIGAGGRTTAYSWALYGGPMYQSTTRGLLVRNLGPVETEPKHAWSAVVGATFGLRISEKKRTQRTQLRPTLQAVVEGGVGNRSSVLVSLRYEYDLLGKLL